jgi:hypothetical protein
MGEVCSQMARQSEQREPPLPGHVASSSDGRWGGPHHLHLPSHQIDMERSTCDLGQCTESGRDLGASWNPSRRTLGDDSPGLRRGTLSGGRAPLAGQRPSSGAAFTLKVVSLFPRLMGKAINRIDGQCVKRSNPINPNSDLAEYHHQLHTGCKVLGSRQPELI